MSRYFNWPVSLKRFVRFDTARAEDVNDSLDELTAGLDVLDQDVNRALKLPFGTADQTLAMSPVQRANLTLGFDGSGNVQAFPNGRFVGDWVTERLYLKNEVFRDSVTKDIYTVLVQHTSGALATDISAARVQLMVNVVDVEIFKNAAAASAAAALVTRDETTALKDETTALKDETTALRNETLVFRYDASVSVLAAQAAASYKGLWVDLTGPLSWPSTVYHVNRFWVVLRSLGDVAASEPGVSSDWAIIGSVPIVVDQTGKILGNDGTNVNWVYPQNHLANYAAGII